MNPTCRRCGARFALVLVVLAAACHRTSPRAVRDATPVVTVHDERAPLDDEGIAIINGTYGPGCDGRSGTWTVRVDETSRLPLEHPPLAVDPDDTDCVLIVISVVTADGVTHEARPSETRGDGGRVVDGSPVVVDIDVDVAQGGDVNVMVVVTDPGEEPVTPSTQVESFAGVSQAGIVSAPDYVFDVSALRLQTNLDDVVTSVRGGLALTARSTRGSLFTVADGALRSYAELDAAFARGSRRLPDWIAASELNLIGADLTTPQVRTVVVASVVGGVASYQALVVTFSPAPRPAR